MAELTTNVLIQGFRTSCADKDHSRAAGIWLLKFGHSWAEPNIVQSKQGLVLDDREPVKTEGARPDCGELPRAADPI